MAFTSTTSTTPGPTVLGNYKFISGTFTQVAGDVGGAITTGLNALAAADANNYTSHIGAPNAKVTTSGGTITIVTGDGVSGTWWALGR